MLWSFSSINDASLRDEDVNEGLCTGLALSRWVTRVDGGMDGLFLECSSALFGSLFVEIELQMFACSGSGSVE